VGSVVHSELERWARTSTLPEAATIEGGRKRFARLLRARGVPADRVEEAAERVMLALRRTTEDDRGRWIFMPQHRDARSELAVSGDFGGQIVNAIVDRSFVDSQGVRWIIDFKTSAHEGAEPEAFLDNELTRYRPQLERYAELLARLGPEPIRLGLYFPLLGGWREWGHDAPSQRAATAGSPSQLSLGL
jgi:hypothetical protein